MESLISVIIPIYNSEQYISDCVQSVQIQSYANLEIIIVDDGSVDKSCDICKEIGKLDKRIRLLSKKHQGVSAARNTGIRAARGKYLFFMDSDDMIHPELLETLYQLLEENSAVMATESYCQDIEDLYKSVDEVINRDDFQQEIPLSYVHLENQEMMCEFLTHGLGGIGGKMIRRAELQFIEFDEQLVCGEDTKLIYQLIVNGADVIILYQKWYFYRMHKENVSKKYTEEKIRSVYESIRYICDNERKNNRVKNAILYEQYIIKCISMWQKLNRKNPNREIKKYLKKIMNLERSRDIFLKLDLYTKKDFYLMLYCYPLYCLNRKISDAWSKNKENRISYKEKQDNNDGENYEKTIKNDGKVSVIISMYNSESYISRCIKSVINQTYSNSEIIVIDGGSTDQCLKICEEIKKTDDRINIFVQPSLERSKAKNYGLDVATGKYIFFLDSDDAIHPLLVEELVQQLENNCVEIALCEYSEWYAIWMEKVLEKVSSEDERPQWSIIEGTDLKKWIHERNCNSLIRMGALISREAIGTLRFDKNILYGNEALFIYNIIMKQLRVAYSAKGWYYHRLYPYQDEKNFEQIKDKRYFDIYKSLRDLEYQKGDNDYALLWERRLLWEIRQKYGIMKENNFEIEALDLRKQALTERKYPLFKKLAITSKLLFYFCFFCYPLYFKLKKGIALLDRIVWSMKGKNDLFIQKETKS